MGTSGCYVADLGTTTLGTVAARIVTGTIRATGTEITVCAWLLFPQCVLFYARTSGWEFVGRAFKESRPVPAMAVKKKLLSEYQTRLGSLVGEQPKICPTFDIGETIAQQLDESGLPKL